MSNNDFETKGMSFSGEIEAPIDVDTTDTADSVKAFAEHSAGMEEMEYYDDEYDIIHRKGNSGVIPNLELLPTNSIRLPEIPDEAFPQEEITVDPSILQDVTVDVSPDVKNSMAEVDAFEQVDYEDEEEPAENHVDVRRVERPNREEYTKRAEYTQDGYSDGYDNGEYPVEEYDENDEYSDEEYDEEYDENEEYSDEEYEEEYDDRRRSRRRHEEEYDEEEYDEEYDEDYSDEDFDEEEYDEDDYDETDDEELERRRQKREEKERREQERKEKARQQKEAKEEARKEKAAKDKEEREKAAEAKAEKAKEAKEAAAKEKAEKAEQAKEAKEAAAKEKAEKAKEAKEAAAKEKAEKAKEAKDAAAKEKAEKAEKAKAAKDAAAGERAERTKDKSERNRSEKGRPEKGRPEKGKSDRREAGERPAGKKAKRRDILPDPEDMRILPGDEFTDDMPVLPEEIMELEDLTYHDEDVKVDKKKLAAVKNASANRNASAKSNHPSASGHGKQPAHGSSSHGSPAGKPVHAGGSGNGNRGNAPHGSNSGKSVQGKNEKEKSKKKFGVVDGLVIGGAVAAVLAICILGASFVLRNSQSAASNSYSEAGRLLASLDGVGDEGITNIIDNRTTAVIESVSEEPSEKESEKASEKKVTESVSVNFSSMEKDLKIKFSDKKTDALITGVLFTIEAKTPDNKTVTWEDTDKDGMIYEQNLTPGTYLVKIKDVADYKFPEKETEVVVKDKITYTAINVVNEIKKEKDINVAKEDTAVKEVDTGTILPDTVKWVDSTVKTVYTEIPKDKLVEPQTVAMIAKSSLSAEPDDDDSDSGESGERQVASFVKSLTISETSKTLKAGESFTITADVVVKGDADSGVFWMTSDSGVASVYEGEVIANNPGTATITCTTNAENKNGEQISKTCKVTVEADAVYVTKIKLEQTSLTLEPEEVVQLGYTVKGSGDVDQGCTFESSDPAVASVGGDGTITANGAGTATITVRSNAKTEDGNSAVATCTVTVKGQKTGSYVQSITLDKSKETVGIGKTVKLTPTVKANDSGVDLSVTWTSNATGVATVSSDGTVTGVAKGTAVITCTTNAKDSLGKMLSATCKITVSSAMDDNVTNLTYTTEDKTYQVYVMENANYREAKYADYYKFSVFYIKEEVMTGWQTVNGVTKFFQSDGKYVTGEQVIGGIKYTFAGDGSLAPVNGTMGIDVSKWNGSIDWNAVRNAGVSFVIIRCGYRGSSLGGLIEDPNFHSYASGAEAAGIKVGVYFFSQAVNEREAVEEASMAISMARAHNVTYPIFIDSEYGNGSHTARADGLSKAERTAVCRAFCETIRSAGYTPGVYASKFWYYNNLDVSQLNQYKIWLAHYTTKTDYNGKYDLWQSSSTGHIPGISGNVDIDTSYLGY